jgi:5-methylcytosine-specific restriction endonuclease McrA
VSKQRQSPHVDIRKAVHERDGWRCWYCGKELAHSTEWINHKIAPSVDHLLPASRGGGDGIDNLVTACFACNAAKHNLTVEEFREAFQLRRSPTHKARLLLGRALAELRQSCGETPIEDDILKSIAWCESQITPHVFFGEKGRE